MNKIMLFLILSLLWTFVTYGQYDSKQTKINGISFLGPHTPQIEASTFQELLTTNSNWVGLIPQATLDRHTLKLKPDEANLHWGNTLEALLESIHQAKEAGLKILVKPHIVLEKRLKSKSSKFLDKTEGASWRGDFKAQTDAEWTTWEKSYENYILKLAHLADSLQIELFSIGTEMREFVIERPDFWISLIGKVRAIYSGKITYCANWDEYDKVKFWDQLDYIGIDAYFPMNRAETPAIKKTLKKWKPIKRSLKALGVLYDKKILLTEFGYRNVSYAGRKPWIHDDGNGRRNDKAQANLYEAFFRAFWEEDWVAGGFAWNWQQNVVSDTDFTIQDKPAKVVISHWYRNRDNY